MRATSILPKSVLVLEIVGVVLSLLALLPLGDYLALPISLNSPLACVVMIFLGVLLIPPAMVVLMWRVAQLLTSQLMSCAPGDSTDSGRDKRDDSSH